MEGLGFLDEEVKLGTSIMAAEFDGGVVLGADSRTSLGAYVADRTAYKLTPVADHVYCCRSGSAADTQAIAAAVSFRVEMMQMEIGEPVPVKIVANDFRQLCYNYRDSLSAAIICAGWDKREGGQVYSIPSGGMISRQPVVISGSGSVYVYGFVDANFKPGMDKEKCVKFVVDTLSLAMYRDGSSGGLVRIVIITEGNVEKRVFHGSNLPLLYGGRTT